MSSRWDTGGADTAPAAEPSSDALHYRDPDGAERRFSLTEATPRLILGRSPRCDLPVPWDGEVSRAHAVLERVGDDWLVADDGMSRNGTYVNGERLTAGRRLQHGDRVRVGSTVLTYRRATPQEGQSTAVAGRPIAVSEAQRRVLRALCRPLNAGGLLPATNREIAAELHLSEDTVKEHLAELFRRFRLAEARQNEKRHQLAQRAREAGLV